MSFLATLTRSRAIFPKHLRLSTRRLASLAEEVRSDSTFHIPVVDFGKFRHSSSPSDKQEAATKIVNAFREVGFVYLSNHGISDAEVANAFTKSKSFFDMSPEQKAKLAWDDPRSNRGYVQQGRERVTQSTDPEEIARLRRLAPDAKESMEIGRDWDSTWKNKWPEEVDVPLFKETMLQFYKACHYLHVDVMSTVAMGLGLDELFFSEMINEQYHNLRLLHYPPIKAKLLRKDGQARAGAHSDYGSLTFVFQDSVCKSTLLTYVLSKVTNKHQVGGLQVQNPHSGQYHPATPMPGTVVVNVGDLLARWSNDVLRSTLHRVVSPSASSSFEEGLTTPSRQSIAFFCNPNSGAEIDVLPTCIGQDRPRRYGPVQTDQYIVGRLSDTYS